ncbi:MAG: factor-independent urate hydroxylase [Planctomycetota bacterium]
MAVKLASNRYGKHQVRVSKIRRPRQAAPNTERHEFIEVAVDVELEGDFETAFTEGDNSSVVATDTCKNTVYVLAKDHPLDTVESFGVAVAEHFVAQYPHVSHCTASLTERVWDRLQDSPHGFTAGAATPTAAVSLERGGEPVVTAGVEKLLIAKTTESGFTNFHRDEYRTLVDTEDRILATELSSTWKYASAAGVDFAAARKSILDALLARFLDHYSVSVQETLFKMGEAALGVCPDMSEITLTMPNKHHILANLNPFDRENDNEVFVVTDEPFGYITGTVAR